MGVPSASADLLLPRRLLMRPLARVRMLDWSTCQLSRNAVCGEGFRLRLLDCVRSDGKVVEAQKCEQVTHSETVRVGGFSQVHARGLCSSRFHDPLTGVTRTGSSSSPWPTA